MAINYPSVGAIVFDKFPAGTVTECCDNVETNLVAAGWAVEGRDASTVVLTMTGQPADTQVVTLDGVSFTAKNTPAGGNDFQIGGTYLETADNLTAKVNANHPNVDAAHNGSGVITFTYSTAGSAGFLRTATENLNNATLNSGTFQGAAVHLLCAATEDRLQMRLTMFATTNTSQLYFRPSAIDNVAKLNSNAGYLQVATGRELTICANAHQCFIWLETNTSATEGQICCGVPYLRGAQKPLLVTGAADNGSGLIRLTKTGHGLSEGQTIQVADLKIGTTFVNGTFTVAVVDADTVDLNASTYPGGTYVADTGMIGTANGRISRAIWFLSWAGGGGGVGGSTWRVGPNFFIGGFAVGAIFGCVNQYYWDSGSSQATFHRLALPVDRSGGVYRNHGGNNDAIEARIGWQVVSTGSPFRWVGDLWAAFVVGAQAPLEAEQNGFDGHNWVNFMTNSKASLWLAKS